MSLPDYYKILEVPVTATLAEIKAAYRRLAKIYHPDKHMSGYGDEEKFKQIREAYETLGNPNKRARYDAKRNRASTFTTNTTQSKKPAQKNYNFTEEDLKRRQYYQQQYKKTQTAQKKSMASSQNKQASELKYILISVPVAVALLLLIIRIYERPIEKKNKTLVYDSTGHSQLHTADSPYLNVFGKMAWDTNSTSVIRIINRSGHDAIVFLQNDMGKILRSHFIENNYELLAENIPPATYRVYYWLGNEFSYRYFLFDTIMGNFKKSISVDTGLKRILISEGRTDTFDIKMADRQSADNGQLQKIFSVK